MSGSIHHITKDGQPDREEQGCTILTANQRYPGPGKVEILSATAAKKVPATQEPTVEVRDRSNG
jgi:hypothetical protein